VRHNDTDKFIIRELDLGHGTLRLAFIIHFKQIHSVFSIIGVVNYIHTSLVFITQIFFILSQALFYTLQPKQSSTTGFCTSIGRPMLTNNN